MKNLDYLMNDQIILSIITPVFNGRKFINKNITILKNITKRFQKEIEVIYINDGSKDGTEEIIKKKIHKIKNFSLFTYKTNQGPGIARNLGIKKSNGKYLFFFDADDELVKKNFNYLMSIIKKKNFDIAFLNFQTYQKNIINLSKKKTNKNKLVKDFLRKELDMNSNFYIFRKKFLVKKNIKYKEGFYEDILFMLKVFVNYEKSIKFTKKIYKKILTKTSITNTCTKKHIDDFVSSSFQKYNYFHKFIKKKFVYINESDLQYGLRGDLVNSIRLLKRLENKNLNKSYIFTKFKKIINMKFDAKTKYDKKVLKWLN